MHSTNPDQKFSDSSSLARHRRIHSGQRPYKCGDPQCQRTFTRKTTLTRHMISHPHLLGDKDEKNRLASFDAPDGSYSEEEDNSGLSQSPNGIPPELEAPRTEQGQTHQYPLVRTQYMPRQSVTQTQPIQLSNEFGNLNLQRRQQQFNLTSNHISYQSAPQSRSAVPSQYAYNPPQPLEPPATQYQQGAGSAHNLASPHLPVSISNSFMWPTNGSAPTYDFSAAYPDPNFPNMTGIYFPGSNVRRPQSTEPENWMKQYRPSNNINSQYNNAPFIPNNNLGAPWEHSLKQGQSAFAI